jgi:hypothetical protein
MVTVLWETAENFNNDIVSRIRRPPIAPDELSKAGTLADSLEIART